MEKIIVESLHRLYSDKSLSAKQIDKIKERADSLLQSKKITDKEYLYILGKEGN